MEDKVAVFKPMAMGVTCNNYKVIKIKSNPYTTFSPTLFELVTGFVQATQFGMKRNTSLLLYGFYSSTTYVNLKR